MVVQKTPQGEVNWIIETKGRKWEGTEEKDTAMGEWCKRISDETGQQWEFRRVNQTEFQLLKSKTLDEAVGNAKSGQAKLT